MNEEENSRFAQGIRLKYQNAENAVFEMPQYGGRLDECYMRASNADAC